MSATDRRVTSQKMLKISIEIKLNYDTHVKHTLYKHETIIHSLHTHTTILDQFEEIATNSKREIRSEDQI